MHMVCFVLASKNAQVDVRLDVGDSLTVEDLVVHGKFTSAELYGDLPHFLDSLHGQRARECKGDCNKKVAPISPSQEDNARKNRQKAKREKRATIKAERCMSKESKSNEREGKCRARRLRKIERQD